jgi:hypothetical protein
MGHYRGKTRTEETKEKIRITKIGARNPNWKGDKVGYASLHEWVRSRLPKSNTCEQCKLVPPRDLANISQEYKRDTNDWEWLCRRCHMLKDGRLKKLHSKEIYLRRGAKKNGRSKS